MQRRGPGYSVRTIKPRRIIGTLSDIVTCHSSAIHTKHELQYMTGSSLMRTWKQRYPSKDIRRAAANNAGVGHLTLLELQPLAIGRGASIRGTEVTRNKQSPCHY
jgi:hypothetical protein